MKLFLMIQKMGDHGHSQFNCWEALEAFSLTPSYYVFPPINGRELHSAFWGRVESCHRYDVAKLSPHGPEAQHQLEFEECPQSLDKAAGLAWMAWPRRIYSRNHFLNKA